MLTYIYTYNTGKEKSGRGEARTRGRAHEAAGGPPLWYAFIPVYTQSYSYVCTEYLYAMFGVSSVCMYIYIHMHMYVHT